MTKGSYFRPIRISLLLGILACVLLLFGVSYLPKSVQAAPIQLTISDIASPITSTNSTVHLPIILYSNPTMPRLASPQDGGALETLIPTLIWETGTQPADSVGCLALSTTPNPTNCMMSYLTDYFDSHMEEVMWFNLEPGTIYYWRVGVVYNYDYDNPKWSTEWSFTTGPTGGIILPAPTLKSPENNEILPLGSVTFQWAAVQDAIEYSISIHDIDQNSWSGGTSTVSQLTLDSFLFESNTHYEWSVRARNHYAWGTESAISNFSIEP